LGNYRQNRTTWDFASLRQRFHNLQWDFNYTYSHSLDNASGLQTSTTLQARLSENALRPNDKLRQLRLRHPPHGQRQTPSINSIGPRQALRRQHEPRVWMRYRRLAACRIFRWKHRPADGQPYDTGQWSDQLEVQSNVTMVGHVKTCPSVATRTTHRSFWVRYRCRVSELFGPRIRARPGRRNILRAPGYVNLDMGLSKIFEMPGARNNNWHFGGKCST